MLQRAEKQRAVDETPTLGVTHYSADVYAKQVSLDVVAMIAISVVAQGACTRIPLEYDRRIYFWWLRSGAPSIRCKHFAIEAARGGRRFD